METGKFGEYSQTERMMLLAELTRLHQALLADSARFRKVTSVASYERAVHNAFASMRRFHTVRWPPDLGGAYGAAVQSIVRDTVMAENVHWVLRQEGEQGKVVLFEHNGHVMNEMMTIVFGHPLTMMGQHLKASLGANMVVLVTANARLKGLSSQDGQFDASSLNAALAQVGPKNFFLDFRWADADTAVAPVLKRPWLLRGVPRFEPMVPRTAADGIVYMDQVNPVKRIVPLPARR